MTATAPGATPRHYLMCEPAYFTVSYEINPWMHQDQATDTARAVSQWRRLRDTFVDLGHTVDLIDPITLVPLDIDTIVESVARTRRLLVVDNSWTNCGASAEIASRVSERLGGSGPLLVRRMGFAPTTCPTTPALEQHFYPNPSTIAEAAYAMARPNGSPWRPDPEHARLAYQAQFKGPF